jgi:opacity protein-like surface antigen
MKRLLLAVLMVGLLAGNALAAKYDLQILTDIGNDTFRTIVREAGMLTAYRGVAPGEPQGITGFDIGVEASFIEIDTANWSEVLGGETTDFLAIPRLHVRKGLPFGLDIGLSYAKVVDSNIELLGGEIQWALLDGTLATPALALRGSYSTLLGVDDLDLKTMAADAILSKGFLMFTPYVGAGMVRIDGKYDGANTTLQSALADQKMTETRFFGGVQVALALLRLTAEAEFSEVPVYTAKLSLGW